MMTSKWKALWYGEAGQMATEYALVVAALALFTIGYNVLFLRALVNFFDGILFMTSLPYP